MRRNSTAALGIVLAVCGIVIVRNAWLSDDAYITFRSVDNFLAGDGLVWNIGERVQAYTHPLWMFIVSLARTLTGEFFYTSLFVSIAISLVAVSIAVRLLQPQPFAVLFLGWLLVLSKAFIDYSTSGLENPLSHLLFAAFLWVLLRRDDSPWQVAQLTTLTALSILTRHDLLLIFAPALLWVAWQGRTKRRTWTQLALGFTPVLAWELFSLLYYGFPFPNTAYAKLNTFIPRLELVHQGLLYLLATVASDPISALVILLCLVAGLGWGATPKYRLMAAGVGLYLLYIVSVGGDFMVGRFLSLPYFAAALLLAWRLQRSARQLVMVGAVATAIALVNPAQNPLLFNPDEQVGQIPDSGITDEKAYYFSGHGLLSATRLNRLKLQGFAEDPVDLWSTKCGGIGIAGFSSTPHTYIIDLCGLTDPLLARLPPQYDLNWRVGHLHRHLPEGYIGTRRTGENLLVDANLAIYYDKLRQVTNGPIFTWARLLEIWRFNTGQYSHLIEPVLYRFPDAEAISYAEITRVNGGEAADPATLPATDDGYFVDLSEVVSGGQILMGMKCATLAVDYYLQGQNSGGKWQRQRVYRQNVHEASIEFGGDSIVLLEIPPQIRNVGPVRMHVIPRICEDVTLHFVDLLAGSAGNHSTERDLSEAINVFQPSLEQLLDLYFVQYQKLGGRARSQALAVLQEQLAQREQAEWQEISVGKRVALFNLPDAALQQVMLAAFGEGLPHVRVADGSELRYLGAILQPRGGEFELDLYFEVLQPFSAEFSLALRADLVKSRRQTFEAEIVDPEVTWEPGTIQRVSTQLEIPADALNYHICLLPATRPPDQRADDDLCWPL